MPYEPTQEQIRGHNDALIEQNKRVKRVLEKWNKPSEAKKNALEFIALQKLKKEYREAKTSEEAKAIAIEAERLEKQKKKSKKKKKESKNKNHA